MSSLMYQGNAVMNARDEGRVEGIHELLKNGLLPNQFPTLAENVAHYADALGVKDIDYWVYEWLGLPRLELVV